MICSFTGSRQGWVVTDADVLRCSDMGWDDLAHRSHCRVQRRRRESAQLHCTPSRYGINNTISFHVSTAAVHRSPSSTMASLQGKKDMRRADLSTCRARPQLHLAFQPVPLYTQSCSRFTSDHVH